jgi:hypothetical protein
MSRIKVLSALIVAGVVTASVGVVYASASEGRPEWATKKGAEEKKVLKAGEEVFLSGTITTNKPWVLKQTAGLGITIECSSNKFTAQSRIIGPRAIRFFSFTLEGCKVTAPAGDTTCEVESTGQANHKIVTQGEGFFAEEGLEGTTKAPFARLRPEGTRNEIVTIQLKGATCTHVGGYEVAGLLVAKIDTSALAKAHKWTFTTNSGTRVTIGGEESTFTGAAEFTLESGNEWGDV